MTTIHKIFLYIGGVLLLAIFAFILFNQIKLAQRQDQITQNSISQKELIDNISRAQSSFASKDDINNFVQKNTDNLKAIQEDLKTLQGQIIAVDQISVISSPQNGTNLPSTSTTPVTQPGNSTATCDPYNYQKNQQNLDIAEKFDDGKGGSVSIPSASVSFNASSDKPWGLNVPKRDYSVTSTIAETQPAGTQKSGQIVLYSQMKINVNGKDYVVPINSSKLLQNPSSTQENPKFRFWNPRLYIGVSGGIAVNQFPNINGSFSPTLGFGFMTYGKQENPLLNIMGVGAGINIVNKDFYVEVNPIDTNLGAVIPFIKSTYVGPSIGFDPGSGGIFVGAGIRVGL